MKKMIFALLVLLLAAPAWATTVTIDCNQVGDTNQVEVTYTTDGTLVRAVGVDITVTDCNIVACEPAMVGECTATVKGLGIFPGTIMIDAGGNVTDYGSPVAPQSDLPGDTQPGLGTSGITVEMGSLYVDGNAPPTSGLLCTLTLDLKPNETSTMTIVANVSRAGNGVVLEDPDEVATAALGTCEITIPPDKCFREGLVDCCGNTITAAQVATWVSLGEPLCWCDACHCRGDANNDCVLSGPDVMTLRAAWPGFGGPYDPCADFDYDGTIAGPDVMILRANWPGYGGPACSGCPPCP
jgi:hypothetical protein